MSDNTDMQYGVFPVVPRANETDQAMWTDKELEKLPYEPASKADEKKSEDKKEGGAKTDGKQSNAADSKPTGGTPSGGQTPLPKG